MNRQEIFNTAYLGIASQGWQRAIGVAGCQYRTSGGLKCAIGWCIPDDKYMPELDDPANNTGGNGLRAALEVAGIEANEEMFEFASNLQFAHDSARTPRMMYEQLINFAHMNNLTLPVLPAGQIPD